MRKLAWLLVVAVAAGCAGGDGFPDQHELGACDATWTGSPPPVQCERGCMSALRMTGQSCSASCADGVDCHGIDSCAQTFTNADGVIGCCVNTGGLATGITVRFLECD